MSVLHQQRIRIEFDAGFRDWAAYCPSCMTGAELSSWADALNWAQTHLREDHCRYCVDRQMPAGRDDLLGELFVRCPVCTLACTGCDGLAVYPTNYNTPTELVEDLATVRLTPIFCTGCTGVTAVIPLDPEVYA